MKIVSLGLLCCLALPGLAQDNLLDNGGFERDADEDGMPDGWDRERQQDNQGTFARDTDVFVEGAASLRIEHPDDNNVWVRSSRYDIPAKPRTLYRFDAKVKATGSYTLLLYEFTPDDPDQPHLTHSVGASGEGHDDWRSYGLAFTTTELARSFKISCITNGPGVAWFDDLRLVRVGSIPEGDALHTDHPPTVDGRLDDDCWRGVPEIGPFYLLGGSGERPAAATWAKVVWTGTDLYVALRCEEPRIDALKVEQTEYDGLVYLDDSIEVFLDPEASGSGYAHVVVNSQGVRFDERQLSTRYNTAWYETAGGARTDWDPAWEAAATVAEGAWSVELRIPFEALGGTPLAGDSWGANFCRERYAEPELSTWSPLAGDTFLQPGQFGRLTFRGGAGRPAEILVREPQHMPALGPVVPRPREQKLGGSLQIDGDLLLRPQSEEAARYLAGCAAIIGGCQVVPADAPDGPRTVDLRIGQPGEDPLPAEGYLLVAETAGIRIVGVDAMGVRNGLMTLEQLLCADGEARWLPAVTIRDWPDCAVRSWHVSSPLATEGAAYENWIDTLAKLKYNTIMLEVNDRLQYESHPEVGRSNAPTKQQLREWVQYAKARGFDVIPQVQVYGHFNWVLNKPGWADLAEDPETDGGRWGRWNANIRDPRYYPLVFDLYQEVIDVFEPAIFHIGHDEITFRPIGVHPDTRDTKPHELLAEEVGRLQEWLTGKGLKVMMWGDQLLPDHHGGPPYNTHLAVDLLPKDIIIADWHYSPSDAFPSVAYFKEHGFPVVACGWWNPLNMYNFSNTAVDEGILGFSGTSWWGLPNFRNSAEHQTAFVLAAENAWSNRNPTIEQLDYEPMHRWRELSGWDSIPAETRYAVVDLSAAANRSLSDDRTRSGWLGLGPDHDFRSLPRGPHWWWGVPYRILDGQFEAVVLAKDGDPPRSWPVSVRAIPVGTTARALYFLATCEAPARRYGSIYDRGKFYPKDLAKYVIHYADGSTEDVPIRYRHSITDWNAGLPPAWGTTVWRGQTAGGAIAQLAAWRWDNPNPDKVIDSIDVRSLEAELRVAVIAITAAVE